MSSRDKKMFAFLAVLATVAVAFVSYLMVISPWLEAREKSALLRKEIAALEQRDSDHLLKASKVKEYFERSLPSDLIAARREYDLVLGELIRKAEIRNSNIVPQGGDGKDKDRIPVMPQEDAILPGGLAAPGGGGSPVFTPSAKDKPAYQKIAMKITFSKVDLKMLGEFLREYHDISLLHHISSMKITRKDDVAGITGTRRNRDRSNPEEWKDLEVEIVTEAICLDGVPDRKSLMSMPLNPSMAVMGGAMYQGVMSKPEAGRYFAIAQAAARAPKPDATASVDGGRFYVAMVGKDLFHGPIPPEPLAPEIVKVTPPPPPPAIDQYIKLNEITRRGDGSVSFQMRDLVNNFTYHGDLRPKGELNTIEVNKNSISPNGKPIKEYSSMKELKISDEGKSSSDYVFQVVAIDSIEGLILMGPPLKSNGKVAGAAATPAAPATGGNRNGGRQGGGFTRPGSSTKLPTPTPTAAGIGGWAVTMPASTDILYYLKYGHSLKEMKVLTPAEVREIVRRNSADGFNPFLNPNITLPNSTEAIVELAE